jgi:large subunit ribosomal protein L3
MRKGSLEFWPHRRAKRQMPRVRSWPTAAEQGFPGFVAFKAGMTHITMIDDTESPAKGTEVSRAVTIVEFPKVYLYGVRAYRKGYVYTEADSEVYDATLAKRVGINKTERTDINALKGKAEEYEKIDGLFFLDPTELGFGNKRVMRFEMPIDGRDNSERLEFASKWLGKEIRASDVLKTGDFVDITSITKGKGWAGVIKRFGVARQYRKATGKVRHVGVLGPWHPAKVMFSVPHSGHMGYNYRTEINKRILKMGAAPDAGAVNVSGGFPNFGSVRGDFMMLEGSIPGPSKRLLRIRKALRNKRHAKEPQITYVSLTSKQGA